MTRLPAHRAGRPAVVGGVGRGVARLAVLAAVVVTFQMVGAASAQAGTYTITVNGPPVCGLGSFMANVPGFSGTCDDGDVTITAPPGGSATNDRELWEIDSPNPALTIIGTQLGGIFAEDINDGSPGYGGGVYWNGGGQPLDTDGSAEELTFGSDSTGSAFSSQYFGLQVVCSDGSGCDGQGLQTGAQIGSDGYVSLAVQENQAPGLVASGSDNLYYQTGHWIWNAPGDPWPADISGTDPSGVCDMSVAANGNIVGQAAVVPNAATWQQCPSPETDSAAVDTTNYVPSSGQLSLALSDTNAAGVSNAPTVTLNVDNVAPSVAITALNDSDPGGWSVNHSVMLRVAPTAGPSGISSVSCSDTLAGTTSPLTMSADPTVSGDDDITVDGNGSHAVACSVADNAVNPQGAHNSGSTAETVDIDEQPPAMSFEPPDPSNPDQIVVQTSDDESPVTGGSIQISPAGSSTATPLATTFTSNDQLIATIPDSTLKAGAYIVQASATSQVGNSASITEGTTLPLRLRTTEAVSFARFAGKLVVKRVRERVLVGWHYGAKLNKHGKPIKVKVGGHYKTIKVIKRVEQCHTRRIKVSKHRWKLKTTCAKPHLRYQKTLKLRHGKRTRVYGELTTTQGVPVTGATVQVLTVPRNGSDKATQVTTVTTNGVGGWSARIPAGPSRIVEGHYVGSEVLLPQTARGHLSVPARIKLTATPTKLPWSGVVTLRGRLVGGYVPKDGVAMRLVIRLPGRHRPYEPVPFRTNSKGGFTVRWTWGTGSGIARYPFSVATTSTESDYPFAAAASHAIKITFGVATPRGHSR